MFSTRFKIWEKRLWCHIHAIIQKPFSSVICHVDGYIVLLEHLEMPTNYLSKSYLQVDSLMHSFGAAIKIIFQVDTAQIMPIRPTIRISQFFFHQNVLLFHIWIFRTCNLSHNLVHIGWFFLGWLPVTSMSESWWLHLTKYFLTPVSVDLFPVDVKVLSQYPVSLHYPCLSFLTALATIL